MNIFIIGPMGAGKTTIGKLLSEELGLKFYDTDAYIEKTMGASISWIFDLEGEEGFRDREEAVIDELTQKKDCVVATGGGAVESVSNRKNLMARGVSVYLRTDLETQKQRTRFSDDRPLLKGANDPGVILDRLQLVREPHYIEVADYIFDTKKKTSRQLLKEIVEKLNES